MDKVHALASAFKDDTMITIALEDGGQFTIQKALLCRASPYFRTALESQFKEGRERKLRIPGCSTKVFELLLYWICEATLPDVIECVEPPRYERGFRDESSDELQHSLVQLWAVADSLLLPELQNATIASIIRLLQDYSPSIKAVKIACEETAIDSGLSRLMLQEFAHDCQIPGGYAKLDMAELGAVPGVLHALINITSSGRHEFSVDPDDIDKFRVEV